MILNQLFQLFIKIQELILSFAFLLFSHDGQPKQQNSLYRGFFFFSLFLIDIVVWLGLGNLFVT